VQDTLGVVLDDDLDHAELGWVAGRVRSCGGCVPHDVPAGSVVFVCCPQLAAVVVFSGGGVREEADVLVF